MRAFGNARALARLTSEPRVIAMNRLWRSMPGQEPAFEEAWLSRDTRLAGAPGFIEFNLLGRPGRKKTTPLYASRTIWRLRDDFEAWTRPS